MATTPWSIVPFKSRNIVYDQKRATSITTCLNLYFGHVTQDLDVMHISIAHVPMDDYVSITILPVEFISCWRMCVKFDDIPWQRHYDCSQEVVCMHIDMCMYVY